MKAVWKWIGAATIAGMAALSAAHAETRRVSAAAALSCAALSHVTVEIYKGQRRATRELGTDEQR